MPLRSPRIVPFAPEHLDAAARAAGATSCICDWRTANLPASRTWRRLGFRVTHARLHRRLDERVVAALGGRAGV